MQDAASAETDLKAAFHEAALRLGAERLAGVMADMGWVPVRRLQECEARLSDPEADK